MDIRVTVTTVETVRSCWTTDEDVRTTAAVTVTVDTGVVVVCPLTPIVAVTVLRTVEALTIRVVVLVEMAKH